MKNSVLFVAYYLFLPVLYGQKSFAFDGESVPPGSQRHFTIELTDGRSNQTIIPLTVFHGKQEGPVLGITAGVHGYEYAPILAGQKLIEKINPSELTGTIILVQVANVPGFLGRTPYLNPIDRKNLNRSFPGNPVGSMTDRIADYISQKIIARCDYFLDMHSGDAPEDLMPYSAYYQHDSLPGISEKGRQMARNMGFDHMVVFKTTDKDYMKEGKPSLYCSAQAFKSGIPAVDIECGRLGMVEQQLVDKISDAVQSLLRHLGMAAGEPLADFKVAHIEDRTYLTSEHRGFFYPIKSSGDYVVEGMKLGFVTDFFNRKAAEIYAPTNGIILFILGTPPVNQGETVVTIGAIKKQIE